MFDIFINTHFSGAHHLRDYPGDCEVPHGHNWKIQVTVRAQKLDNLGMALDFTVLKKHVKEVIDQLDHRDLNNMEAFATRNPSSEHIAMFIYDNLLPTLPADKYTIYSIKVMETDNQGVLYYGPDADS